MASNSLVVNVVISKSIRVVSQASFNIACIFGPSARVVSPTLYTAASDMLVANGGPFMTSDPEYIEANAFMSQQGPKPPSFLVAPNTVAVAQQDTFAVGTLSPSTLYKFVLNSVPIQYMSAPSGDTQQSILAALLAAIGVAFPSNPPVTGSVTGTGPSALLTLNAVTPGLGVSYASITSNLTHLTPIANHSIAEDIATAQAALLPQNQFYGVIVTSHVASDILQVMTYVESQLLVYLTASADSDCLTSVTTDIMSIAQAESFDRSMILYSAQANTNGPDGAWLGYMIAVTPGIGNYAMKTLAGVSPDNLNPTQISNVLAKNGNIYVTIGGNGATLYGIAPGGEYFDVTIFLDWVSSNMQSGVIAVETDPANLKIPYTNQGIAMIETPIRTVMQLGQDNQGFAPGWDVFGPDVSTVPQADKKNRVLNGVGFDGELAGAINKINIQGYVTS